MGDTTTSYLMSDCEKRLPNFIVTPDIALTIGKSYKFLTLEKYCWSVVEVLPDTTGLHYDVYQEYDSCAICLGDEPTTAEIIIEDDVNLRAEGVMTVNEKLLSLSFGVALSNGIVGHEIVRFGKIPLPQNYTSGFLDIPISTPVTFQMPWAINFPSGAVNNTAEIYTSGNTLRTKLPTLINWRYFQSLPQLASIFGVDATNNWLWYQQNGWQIILVIELENETGVYQDYYPVDIRDYDDNPDVDWTWEFFRVSDNVQVSAPISTEPVRVVVTTTQSAFPASITDASTITVEGIEKPIRWVISSEYAHTGQATSPMQPLPTEPQLLFTATASGTVAEFIFDPSKVQGQDGVKFTARNYKWGASPLYTERNVVEFPIAKLPPEKLKDEYESDCCDCLPELKLASFTSEELIHNDITGFAHKNQIAGDTCEFKIFKGGQLLANNGVDYPNGFPHDPKVSAFIWNWKWYLVNHGQGCYKIEKHYTIAGLPLVEELGVYNLLEYTPENAKGTARVLYQNNFQTLWDENTINYTDSGFEDSYRFRGMFGNWQPNVQSESNFSVLNENRVASIKSKDTYILNHFHATECHIKRLHKIVMHATIWRMSDHNPSNTLQEKKIYECILDAESKEQIDYTAGSRVTGIEVILSKRQQNSVSLFGGSVQVPQGVTWLLPTVTGGGGTCLPSPISIAGTYKGDLPSGDSLNIITTDQNDVVITPISGTVSGGVATVKVNVGSACPPQRKTGKLMSTGQVTSYADYDDGYYHAGRDWLTLPSAPLHDDGSATLNLTTNRFTDTLGLQLYANGVVLDWSTWDGSSMLGYPLSINSITASDWQTVSLTVTAYTLAGFTGWRFSNMKEVLNVSRQGNPGTGMSYPPFNAVGSGWDPIGYLWLSQLIDASTAVYIEISTGRHLTSASSKTAGTAKWLPVRDFYLSTLNILS